jgi:hypothetical protein
MDFQKILPSFSSTQPIFSGETVMDFWHCGET